MMSDKLSDEDLKKLGEAFKLRMEEDGVNEPDYYGGNGLSPLVAFREGLLSEDEYKGFLKGNIIKYAVRCDKKNNGYEDMLKCIDYCNYLKELFYKE